MRKVCSIVFATLLLYSSIGYYGLFLGLRYQRNVEMMQKLDEADYKNSDEIAIKIPLVIPYAADDADYKRVDGMFEYKGEFYRMVKQRRFQDTLHVVCIKDHELAYINQAWESYVKTFTDNHSDSQSDAKSLSSLIKDYLPRTFSILSSSQGWVSEVSVGLYLNLFVSDFCPSIIHPPERVS